MLLDLNNMLLMRSTVAMTLVVNHLQSLGELIDLALQSCSVCLCCAELTHTALQGLTRRPQLSLQLHMQVKPILVLLEEIIFIGMVTSLWDRIVLTVIKPHQHHLSKSH